MTSCDSLFSSLKIGNKIAPNRFVSQAMEANDADPGGKVSERAIERYKRVAEGGWGVIVVEALSITDQCLARKNQMILRPENQEGYKRFVDEIKKVNPDCVLLFQVTHSGRNSNSAFSQKVSICPNHSNEMKYLFSDDIQKISDLFVEGTLLAEKAGADGVDFKMCHGYFGAEMLRPANTRDDKWGGSLENRCRFLNETIAAIRSKLQNPQFILGSRISMYEAIRGGCGTGGPDEIIEDLSEMFQVIEIMHHLGMNYVNVSAGIPGITSEVTRPVKGSEKLQLNHLRYTKNVKQQLSGLNAQMKTIGSAYSILKQDGIDLADEVIRKGYSDFIGWGRQSFADPLMPKKIQNGDDVNWCTACSGCSKLMIAQENDGCILYNPYYKNLYKEMMRKKKNG